MAWTLYLYTAGGISIYCSSHNTQGQARNAGQRAFRNGYVNVPDADGKPDWIVSLNGSQTLLMHVIEETDPGPNGRTLDRVTGLDIV